MVWINIVGNHFNADHIRSFYWQKGLLVIGFDDRDAIIRLKDPDRNLYCQMCSALEINPWED